MPYARDPISEWFDPAAQNFLTRAYADFGQYVTTWLPQPTRDQRGRAQAMWIDVDGPDPEGHEPSMWVRAFKRSCRWNLRHYGYATELRPGRDRLGSDHPLILMIWDSSAGLVTRPPLAEHRYEIKIRLYRSDSDGIRPATRPADDQKGQRQ